MTSRLLILFVLLALALAACNGANPGGEVLTLEPQATEPGAAEGTPAAGATTAPGGETGGQTAAVSAPAGCTVVSLEPTPGPTEQSAFPPIGPDDWVQGPAEAAVSFVEYGDFQ